MEDKERICLRLTDEVFLVAEINIGAHIMPYKEIFVGLERDGVWFQDLAVIREKYYYEDTLTVVPEHGRYEVLVYSDSDDEDYTHRFVIEEHIDEEE